MNIAVRRAELTDDAELDRIDRAAFAGVDNVAPVAVEPQPFFSVATPPDDLLVAEVDGGLAGYVNSRRRVSCARSS